MEVDRMRRVRQAFALSTLGLGLGIAALGPHGVALSGGWFTPVLAFEFARVPADVAFLDTIEVRDTLDRVQQLDLVFPFLYAGLLLTTGLSRVGWGRVGAFGGLAVVFDLWENAVMAGVSEAVAANGDVARALAWLPAATWSKWLVIAASLGSLGLGQGVLARSVLWATAGVSVVAWLTRSPVACEAMGVCVLASFAVLIVQAFRTAPSP